jgi:hypothetical protein
MTCGVVIDADVPGVSAGGGRGSGGNAAGLTVSASRPDDIELDLPPP